MFTLVYARDGQPIRLTLSAGDTVVGRATVCDCVIDDPSISRRHARFRVHGDHCVVTDLGGRNGTFINGEQVTESEVRDGDTVVLGRFSIRLERSTPAVLSDAASPLDSPHTVLRRIEDSPDTHPGVEPAANPARLLLLLSEISRQLV